jgi:diguanylate cyclase (GGDEF)-like protein/PAS domain S-box-containing protein
MERPIDICTLAVTNATHHAIFLLDENGVITSWNSGGERIFGYRADEIIGCSTAIIFTEEDIANGQHVTEMKRALDVGYSENDRWHLRKDGTRFWASGIMTPAYDDTGTFRGFLKVTRDKTPDKLANERALYLSRHDTLTSLPNRSMFHEELQAALAEAKLSQSLVQVFLLDLDRFKEINDSYGHHIGDLFLKQVAKRLKGIVRSSDLVARLGGDEFGIICKTAVAGADGVTLAEKLVSNLSAPYLLEEKEIQSGASIGLTVYPLDSKDTDQILKNADLAMYAAKSSGRSAYRLYTEDLDADAKRRRDIGDWLRKAMQDNSLMLHYQPQYSLQDNRVTSVEALLRWRQCPVSDITSEEIIATAAEIGLASAVGEWTLRAACNQAREWRARGIRDFRVAVNVSSSQLNAVSFLKLIDSVLEETGIPPECLDLEITEFTLMENNQANDLLFKSLKKKGVYLSVDDFGTGFSSFSSLKTFPVDTLKIDREFIKDLPQSEHDAAIASAIIGLAHSLNLKAAAEGIERPEQAEFLAALGCDYGQGFLFGAPAPPEEIW